MQVEFAQPLTRLAIYSSHTTRVEPLPTIPNLTPYIHPHLAVGLNTGMGKPAVFPKQCDRVTWRFGGISLVNILTTYFGFPWTYHQIVLDIPPPFSWVSPLC